MPNGRPCALEAVHERRIAAVIAEKARGRIGVGGKFADALDERRLGVRKALLVPVVALAAVELVALLAEGGRDAQAVADAAADPAQERERERGVDINAARTERAVDGAGSFENAGASHGGARTGERWQQG